MLKIAYVLTSGSHKRVFETIEPRNNINQLIVGPNPQITNNIIPEDYSDFRMKNIKTYSNNNEMIKIVNAFNPDVYVQSDLSKLHKAPVRAKKVIVHHGAVGNHAVGIAKKLGSDISVWKGFDHYYGANKEFANWASKIGRAKKSSITINAAPQFDLLYDKLYYTKYRDQIIKKRKPKKIVLFAGFCCKDRIDFNPHNEDYFRTAIELGRLATKNNWLVMIKPRHTHTKMMEFLRSHSWGKKYISSYNKLQSNNNVHFITTTGHIYRYFFADCFVVNGSTTIELEACAIGKPLVIIKTQSPNFDPYNSVNSGAATGVTKVSDLEEAITNTKDKNIEQKELLSNHGITIDGLAHTRLQNSIEGL